MCKIVVISECSEYKGYKFKIEIKYKDFFDKHDVLKISEINDKNVFYNYEDDEKVYDLFSIKEFCEFKNNQEEKEKNSSYICFYVDFIKDLEKDKSLDLALIKTNLKTALRHLK